MAVILTETFEKVCLRADIKTVLYVITCLYAANLLMISGQENVDFLERERDWAKKLFTPVCSKEEGNSSEICDIPFSTTKMYMGTLFIYSTIRYSHSSGVSWRCRNYGNA